MATDNPSAPPFHVAVFCKAPVPGQVKTRLIPAFGAAAATALYRDMVRRSLATVQAVRDRCGARASLWVADDITHPQVRAWAATFDLALHRQRGTDLGERMLHCLQTLGSGGQSVLLIGTDCPSLRADDLIAAGHALRDGPPWVFTPAEDGGYVLVGSRAATVGAFAHVHWSTPQVMAQTRAALTRCGERWAEMPTRWDVDEPADVHRAVAAGLLDLDGTQAQ